MCINLGRPAWQVPQQEEWVLCVMLYNIASEDSLACDVMSNQAEEIDVAIFPVLLVEKTYEVQLRMRPSE